MWIVFQFILVVLVQKLIAQDAKEHYLISLENDFKGDLKAGESSYFRLKELDNPNKQDLLIRVYPRDDEEHMYDPDLFVSVVLFHIIVGGPSKISFSFKFRLQWGTYRRRHDLDTKH